MSKGDEKAKKATDLLNLLESLSIVNQKSLDQTNKDHKFWSTQPVPQSKTELIEVDEDGPIDSKAAEKIRRDPYELPEGLKFSEFNIDSESDLNELYQLLCENYVEDYDSLFRFEYSSFCKKGFDSFLETF